MSLYRSGLVAHRISARYVHVCPPQILSNVSGHDAMLRNVFSFAFVPGTLVQNRGHLPATPFLHGLGLSLLLAPLKALMQHQIKSKSNPAPSPFMALSLNHVFMGVGLGLLQGNSAITAQNHIGKCGAALASSWPLLHVVSCQFRV